MLVSSNNEVRNRQLLKEDKCFSTTQNVRLKQLNIFIVGCGTVGSALIEQISRQHKRLLEHDISLQVIGIANSKGLLIDAHGKLLSNWQQSMGQLEVLIPLESLLQYSYGSSEDETVLVDCTASQSIAHLYPRFFEKGFHVVTANKIANTQTFEHYQYLRSQSKFANRKFLYETNIGAGLPVIEPLQKLIKSGDRLKKFEGVLSGSLSFIFGELHNGLTLSEATQKAKQLGFTEPDPRQDLSGLDVARKALIIAREFGIDCELEDIKVDSVLPQDYSEIGSIAEFERRLPELDDEFSKLVQQAEKNNKVLRYVAELTQDECKVSIRQIAISNPLYSIKDGENVLSISSFYYSPKPMVIRGYGAGAEVTAAGVFSDILRILN